MDSKHEIPGIHSQKEAEEAAYSYTDCIDLLKVKNPNYYVCNFQIYESQDKLYTTWCTWSDFMPVVMPKTDYVAVVLINECYSDVYKIKQNELMKILGEYAQENFDPTPHFVVSGLEENENLTDSILDKATYINRQNFFAYIEGKSIPAKSKYFIKLWLHSKNPLGERMVLFFHQTSLLDDFSNAQFYASKVNTGETLEKVLNSEITNITGLSKYEIQKIVDDDTAPDRYGNEIKRYAVFLEVPYFDPQGKQVIGLNMSWHLVSKIPDNIEHNWNF